MVFYSTKSSRKIFHLPHCRIIGRIHKKYKKQFATPEEARMAGYRMCNCCCAVGKKLRKEQQAVNQFCQENGVACWLEDEQLHVLTPCSEWRIIVNGKAHKLFLYHKNAYERYEEIPSIIPGFHSQATRSTTIVGYLNYIIEHDIFRRNQAKKYETIRRLKKRKRNYERTDRQHLNAGRLYTLLNDACG